MRVEAVLSKVESQQHYFDASFKSLDLQDGVCVGTEFEECSFVDCNFSSAPSVTLVVRLINFNRTDKTECNDGFLQHRFQRANGQENDAA